MDTYSEENLLSSPPAHRPCLTVLTKDRRLVIPHDTGVRCSTQSNVNWRVETDSTEKDTI